MFLEHIKKLKLLEHDPASNTLNLFPLVVKKKLIHEVTQVLSINTLYLKVDPTLPLSHPSHVTWAFEVIGQGFTLPVEDHETISEALTVYSMWLLKSDKRPIAIQQLEGSPVEQNFFQTIFKHFSLLFSVRPPNNEIKSTQLVAQGGLNSNPSSANLINNANFNTINNQFEEVQRDNVSIHVELCKTVLRIIMLATKNIGEDKFTEETWIVLLKVLIGISDYILSQPLRKKRKNSVNNYDTEDTGSKMADLLCADIIQVFLEVWLRSKIKNKEMWERLKDLFTNWTLRLEIILQWNVTILGLTNRVIRLIYGNTQGCDDVFINSNNYSVHLNLPDTHSLDELSPGNFLHAVLGVGKVVEAFHSIESSFSNQKLTESEKSSAATIPDGNTILHMFGAWLFDATTKSNEFEQGIAEAYGILCRIFCHQQRRAPFQKTYLERFYTAISEGLKGNSYSVTTIFINCSSIFSVGLEGVRILMPNFVFVGLRRVLPNLQQGFRVFPSVTLDDLRKSAYCIIGQLISIPNRYPSITAKDLEGGNYDATIDTESENVDHGLLPKLIRIIYAQLESESKTVIFLQIKMKILDILLSSLVVETTSNNIKLCLSLLQQYVVEDVHLCPGLPNLVIRTIQDKILTPNHWQPNVVIAAFETLNQFIIFADHIQRDNKSCPRELVLTLCRYIEMLLNEDNIVQTNTSITKAYECMIKWALVGQWIATDKDCENVVLSTLCRGITVLDKDDQFANISPIHQSFGVEQAQAPVLLPSTAVPQVSFTPVPSSLEKDKSKRMGRTPTTASKMFEKLQHAGRSSSGGNAIQNTVVFNQFLNNIERHNSQKDNSTSNNPGVGLPTFAKLSAGLVIQISAEIAMAHLSNYLANFPPLGERTGVSSISSLWKEENEIFKFLVKQRHLKKLSDSNNSITNASNCILSNNSPSNFNNSNDSVSFFNVNPLPKKKDKQEEGDIQLDKNLMDSVVQLNANSTNLLHLSELNQNNSDEENQLFPISDYKKFVRYFSFDKRVIIGLVELPEWRNEKLTNNRVYQNGPVTVESSCDQDVSKYARSSIASTKQGSNAVKQPSVDKNVADPSIVLVLRDVNGKHTWMTTLKYIENEKEFVAAEINNEEKENFLGPGESLNSLNSSTASGKFKTMNLELGESIHSTEQQQNLINQKVADFPNPNKQHFQPKNLPFTPKDSVTLKVDAYDEEEVLPKINKMFEENSESANSFKLINEVVESEVRREELIKEKYLQKNLKEEKDLHVFSPAPIDFNKIDQRSDIFRLFLAQYGFLSLENKDKLIPLNLTENLFKDLAKFDALPERECFGVSLFFCSSSKDSIDKILTPKYLSEDFHNFIYSIAWPVDLEKHVGYKGNLNSSFCKTAPYFADRNVEVIFHCPYLMRCNPDQELEIKKRKRSGGEFEISQLSNSETLEDLSVQNNSDKDLRKQLKGDWEFTAGSSSPLVDESGSKNNSNSKMAQNSNDNSGVNLTEQQLKQEKENLEFKNLFSQIASDDLVYIIWIEDIKQAFSLPKKILSSLAINSNTPTSATNRNQSGSTSNSNNSGVLFMFIHPLPHTQSLYWVRLLITGPNYSVSVPQDLVKEIKKINLNTNCIQLFGPLYDGAIVSRHSLILIRNTAISAHSYIRSQRGSYRKP
ncbi:hypothetical protein HK099_002758 [Clydaea vesicula]|uniref:Rap-GAP domain-containing protein n=1 Tax=Clydaea vesicula TaxID=447962 RepID=A0AAD5Y0L7_9FUNG|nr:hypothetical protein HK099_002758 [Clydaea vesicula]